MNKIYLFAIASILATASLMVAGTFTVASFAQISTLPSSDTGSTMMDTGSSTNSTGGNVTSGGTDNSTTPM